MQEKHLQPVPSTVAHDYSSSSSRLSSFHHTFHSLCFFTAEITIQPCSFLPTLEVALHMKSIRFEVVVWLLFSGGSLLVFCFFVVLCLVSIVKYYFPAVNCNRFRETTLTSPMKTIICCYTKCSLMYWFWLG